MENKDIQERTLKFGVKIIWLVRDLPRNPAGFAVGNQIVRSGTSIGANIAEAQDAASRADFTRSINISLKEARETEFWLKLIIESGILPVNKVKSILAEVEELVKILRTSLKKLKQKTN